MDKSVNNISKKSHSGSFLDWITQYDALVVFGGFGVAILATIIINGIFQAGPMVRTNLLFNAIGAIMLAAGFIYVILKFMGNKVVIFGKTLDIGMLLYIIIILFIMFIFGN